MYAIIILSSNENTQVRPSSRRLSQYRADLTSILLVSHDILLSLAPSVAAFFLPAAKRSQLARSVHAKCTVLVTALTIVGCPIKVRGGAQFKRTLSIVLLVLSYLSGSYTATMVLRSRLLYNKNHIWNSRHYEIFVFQKQKKSGCTYILT